MGRHRKTDGGDEFSAGMTGRANVQGEVGLDFLSGAGVDDFGDTDSDGVFAE
jgi:hypothetical protein